MFDSPDFVKYLEEHFIPLETSPDRFVIKLDKMGVVEVSDFWDLFSIYTRGKIYASWYKKRCKLKDIL